MIVGVASRRKGEQEGRGRRVDVTDGVNCEGGDVLDMVTVLHERKSWPGRCD